MQLSVPTPRRLPRSVSAAAFLAAAMVALLAACGSGASGDDAAADPPEVVDTTDIAEPGELVVNDVWSRRPAPGQSTVAVYGQVTNGTDEERRLVSASSSATDRVELHETVFDDNGVATMESRNEGFVIASGAVLSFEPGGAHVMLRDMDADAVGSSIDVVFVFDDGHSVTTTAEVRDDAPAGAVADMDHIDHDDAATDDHDHSDHDDAATDDHDHSDHDHAATDDHDHSDHDHGEAAETLDLDVTALHHIDDELAAGTLDAEAQRAVVADYITELEALEPAPDSGAAELLGLLQELDAALEQQDLQASAFLAKKAHIIAHSLVPHS